MESLNEEPQNVKEAILYYLNGIYFITKMLSAQLVLAQFSVSFPFSIKMTRNKINYSALQIGSFTTIKITIK